MQEFSFADIDRFSSASLITRMTNDVNAMTMMLAMGLRMLVRAPVMLVAALCISFYLNARLALVLVVVIPLMVLVIGILMKVCTKLFETMQTKIDNLNNTAPGESGGHPGGEGLCPGGLRAASSSRSPTMS